MSERRQEHYFTVRPESLSQPVIHEDTLLGIPFKFWSDYGVFSRGHTDTGTRELLDAMDVHDAQRILDLGCGYGVIGIVAARVNPEAHIVMTEPNERAVELTRQNLQTNQIGNAEVRQGEGYLPVADEQFDVILTNPPFHAGNALIFQLIAGAVAHLAPEGRFYLVARTRQGAKTFAKEMARQFGNVEQVGQGSGYRVFCSKKESVDKVSAN